MVAILPEQPPNMLCLAVFLPITVFMFVKSGPWASYVDESKVAKPSEVYKDEQVIKKQKKARISNV